MIKFFNFKYGQLGQHTVNEDSIPNFIKINLDPSIKFVDISAGWAVNMALTDVGNVYAWGKSINNGANTGIPTLITSNIAKISASDKSLLLLGTNGNAYTFGEGGVCSIYFKFIRMVFCAKVQI
jgi:alpha-tubulin suppressor-like RCC1 family protein